MAYKPAWIKQYPLINHLTQPREIGLKYLRFLSDDFGIWQHSLGNEIDKSQGYALDDVTRALWVANAYQQPDLQEIYFNFIQKACLNYPHPVNFFDSQRQPVLNRGFSLDALGQVCWVLQILSHQSYRPQETEVILTKIRPYLVDSPFIRPIAYQLLSSSDLALASNFAQKMERLLTLQALNNWYWPEASLTYGNAVLPWSMFKTAQLLKDPHVLNSARKMLDFINQNCTEGDKPSVIGNKGWYPQEGIKQQYDQQPIDIAYLVLANLQAHQTLKELQPDEESQLSNPTHYLQQAWFFYSWYWGNNLQNQLMLNLSRESVYDGLTEKGHSGNQGAENIVTFLMAQAEMLRE